MVASTLGLEEDFPSTVSHEELHSDGPDEFVHPWAREMFRVGYSFNGNERHKLFLGQGDGSFRDFSDLSGADTPLDGRAVVSADFDDDGDLDIFLHNLQGERHKLYRNEANLEGKSFIKLRLRAQRSQHEAIGAEVTVSGTRGSMTRVLARGSGFLGCDAPELIFGLGRAERGRVSVRWPSGQSEEFGWLEAGARALLIEGAGRPEVIEPRPFRLHDPLPEGLKLGIGERVPELVLLDAEGQRKRIDLSRRSESGELYLSFWASYCAPCLAELPALAELHESPGRSVLAVSVDAPQDRARAQRALESAGAGYPAYYLSLEQEDNAGGVDALLDLMRLAVPTTLILDSRGRIRSVLHGPIHGE